MPKQADLPLEAPVLTDGRLVPNVPFADYHAHDAINASGLKTILRSPMHYFYQKVNPPEETPAMRFGRIVHAAILEPRSFAANKVVRPKADMRTNKGRQELAAWRADLGPNAIEMTEDEAERIDNMLLSCANHPRLAKLLETGGSELSLLWHDEEHDVDCKARYDFVSATTNVIVDLKTTVDARAEPFARDMIRFQYGLSAFHYLEGARATGVARPDEFVWAVVEKDMPHGVALYRIDAQEIERCRHWWHKAMTEYGRCKRSGHWPGYPEEFAVLETPPWAPRTLEYQSRGAK